jgi:hypothetical protein
LGFVFSLLPSQSDLLLVLTSFPLLPPLSRLLSVTFVVAHLAAFADQVDKRQADYETISSKISFPYIPSEDALTMHAYSSRSDEIPSSIGLADERAGTVFWAGDLNCSFMSSAPDFSLLFFLLYALLTKLPLPSSFRPNRPSRHPRLATREEPRRPCPVRTRSTLLRTDPREGLPRLPRSTHPISADVQDPSSRDGGDG